MSKQVFIINGSGGVGKDTFIALVAEKLVDGAVMNFSSVDKVKEIAKMIGWDGAKSEKDRKFLSDLKALCTQYNDMPLHSMRDKVNEFMASNAQMLFLHIREPEEIERARVSFNAKTLLVKRDSVCHITSNLSDGSVFSYNYDIVVCNNGTIEEFADKARMFTSDFKEGSLRSEY